jgi:hypothetical protein
MANPEPKLPEPDPPPNDPYPPPPQRDPEEPGPDVIDPPVEPLPDYAGGGLAQD